MKFLLAIGLLFSLVAAADTPPPGTVKAKMFTGDGVTGLTATGDSLNVNITGGGGGGGTVDQGTAGTDPWFVSVRNNAPLPVNACQETGGNLASILTKLDASIAVTGTFWQATQPVSGTFWQTTQPVSAASLPLPTGAATAAKQPALGTAGTPSSDVLTVQGATSMTALKVDGSGVTQPVSGTFWQTTQPVSGTVTANAGTGTFTVDASGHTVPVSGTFWQATQPVSGTFWQATQPVSAASLPLPSGASTAAKQPALGTAGTASSDVISVQGIASMTALKVDGSGVTQPVSGTFWQATQPVSGTVTANAGTGTFTVDGSGHTQPVSGTFWQTTQPVSIATAPVLVAGSAIIGKVGIDQTTPGTTNLVALAANQSVNVAQINGVTPLMGNGTTGTGSQRVTIASDNTAFSVNTIPKPSALTIKQAALSIGTSAARLTNDGSAPASTRVLLAAQLVSTSTANCYFGSSGVTTTSTTRGVQMFAGQTLSFSNDAGDYYAICDAVSQTIFVTEQE